MKVAVLSTYAYAKEHENYGSALQYFALQEFLRKNGYEACWIRYDPSVKKIISTDNIKKLFSPKTVIRFVNNRIVKFGHKKYPRNFQDFFISNLRLSERIYGDVNDLKQNYPDADVYIVGSDQVWTVANEINFLDFGPPGVKKISYAASGAWQRLSHDWYVLAAKYLSGFSAISVREEQGLEHCKLAGICDAVSVLDPTFLLPASDYLNLTRNLSSDDDEVLLCYFLNIRRRSSLPWSELVNFSSSGGLKLKVIPLQGAESCIPKENLFIPNIPQWIKSFSSANCIVTNSFHGTVFSIIMKRPFLVVLQDGYTATENSRFISILSKLGLENRIYNSESSKSLRECMHEPIDWDNVSMKLDYLRKTSADWLLESLCQ
ncbi:polysaccharide pyruvyl transferase family protein [Methylobacillus sp. Pita1]|uniref:polysaccharide pyruvyl transferase family protein n=1 Tax=Methylobacillus sp. Pita1 TaxID=3382642 RepID=UPI0038B62AE0